MRFAMSPERADKFTEERALKDVFFHPATPTSAVMAPGL
jgi:hypothetical protein